MTRRLSPTLFIFLAGVFAVVAGLGWVTFHALRLDRHEQAARADAQRQEAIRLALWRMDSLVSPIIAREAARPASDYQPFYTLDQAYTKSWQEVPPGDVLVPSPLLGDQERFVRLHFQRNADGSITSPQAPTGNMRDQAESSYVGSVQVIEAEEMLGRLSALVHGQDLACTPASTLQAAAQRELGGQLGASPSGQVQQFASGLEQPQLFADTQAPVQSQTAQSVQEYDARRQVAESARNVQRGDVSNERYAKGAAKEAPDAAASAAPAVNAVDERSAALAKAAADLPSPRAEPVTEKKQDAGKLGMASKDESAPSPSAPPSLAARPLAGAAPPPASKANAILPRPPPETGELVPIWVHDAEHETSELLLIRNVTSGKSRVVQGVWLDWPALRDWLLEQVSDRLPAAKLGPVIDAGPAVVPVGDDADTRLTRRLAAIPAELVVNPAAVIGVSGAAGWTPMRTALVLAWLAAIAAVGVIALVLRASVELAERRGRFVSAVTHELRTPLTTFCLYSQMLADGMVPQEAARKEYLGTLKREAQRLARIVENVLEYARLGRKRPANHRDHLSAQALVERLTPPLRERVEQAGMQLVVEADGLLGVELDTDAQTVERIIYNLVDNACKYAADAADGRVYLCVRAVATGIQIEVADHGPGVKPEDEPKVFDPFYRGKHAADAASPGLGLGLALARGLARQLGGDLRLVRHKGPGACFVLSLPNR